jgi:hypothetical protein
VRDPFLNIVFGFIVLDNYGLVIVLESNVTAAMRVKALPYKVAPVVNVIA